MNIQSIRSLLLGTLLAILVPSSLLAPYVVPPVLSITIQGTNVVITATGLPGAKYVFQASDTVGSNANWTSISTNIAGGSGIVNMFPSDAYNFQQRFYRAVIITNSNSIFIAP